MADSRRSRLVRRGLAVTAFVGAVLVARSFIAPPEAPPRGAGAERAVVAPNPAKHPAVEGERVPRPGSSASAARQGPSASDAESVTYLAETSDDPRVIEASLREVLSVYSSRSSQKRQPDAALDRVLIKHVASADPSIAAAALTAARIPLMSKQPSDALTSAIAELTADDRDPGRRGAALEALNLLRPDRRAPGVLAAVEAGLAATEPYVASLALLALSQSGPSLEALPEGDRARIAERVLGLGRHADPGVRGRSLAVLSELEWLVSPAARYAAAEQHFRDVHPYVRAQAADLFLRCRQPSAIHRLVDAVSDLSPARYELEGFTALDGKPGTLVHAVPGRPRVAESALLAMRALSERVRGAPALGLTLGGRPEPDGVVRDNAELSRAWYRAHRDRIPREPVAER